jgi:hypothetical protein
MLLERSLKELKVVDIGEEEKDPVIDFPNVKLPQIYYASPKIQ